VTKGDAERGHSGYNLLVIEMGTPGFVVTRTLEKLGMHSSDTAELLFEDCHVPVGNLIGEEGEGFKNLMWELQGERMIAAAGAVAGAQAVFDYTADYARNRMAFGQPIAQFQVIKHKLVDMGTKIAAIQAFVYQTAKQWDQGEYPVREISQAKLLATQVACDVAGITTTATRYGNEYIVNGRKIFITNGARCQWALVVTKGDRERGHSGYNLLVIEKGTPGFEVTRTLEKLGMHSSDTAELLFEDCHVPAGNLIGEEGEGFKNLMWELQGERMIAAAGAIAGAQRVFEYAMDYAKNRVAFGKPVASFQVIKHKLVDMGTKIAATQSFVYETAQKWDRGEYPVREISQAKLLATQVACEVADDAIQILGGHGYMREFPVERAWRDARLARIGAGTDEIMKEIIAKSYGL